ncbi:MAG: hypothetical protein JWQ79_2013 [Mucilaginibacter sp.]|nr:hypothetical protein [Mucilaginibacter sp.]
MVFGSVNSEGMYIEVASTLFVRNSKGIYLGLIAFAEFSKFFCYNT